MKVRILAFAPILFLSACATNPWRANDTCIDLGGDAADFFLAGENLIDAEADIDGAPAGTTRLVVDECFTKVFTRRGYRYAFMGNPNDKFLGYHFAYRKDVAAQISGDECQGRAVRQVAELQIPYFNKILDDYRNEFSNLWDDPKLGPRQWLNCPKDPSKAFQDYPALLSALNSELTKGPCLNLASKGKDACFALRLADPKLFESELPVDLSSFFRDDQKAYYGQYAALLGSVPFLSAFGNLVSQSIYYDVALTLQMKGKPPEATRGASVRGPTLAFGMNLLLRRLEMFRSADPRSYSAYLGARTESHASLAAVLDTANEVLDRWESQLKKERSGIDPAIPKLRESNRALRASLGI